jgi:transposase
MTESTIETVGCDLGDKWSELCVLKADGTIHRPKRVPSTREGMKGFFEGRPRAHVVIEVGTHSRWVSLLLKELGHQVTVANPRRVKLISQSNAKNDRKDAELLARLGRADVQLLAPIEHRGDEVQADLAIAKARDALVVVRTKLVNQARGLTKSFGYRLPKCIAASFFRLTREFLPKELEPALGPIYESQEQIAKQIHQFDKKLEELAKKYPDAEVVGQIHGVGLLTALVFILTLEDKNRFAKSRTVGAFIGIRPRQDQSGDQDKQLHITKAGDPMLRRLLVQCAHYVLGPFGPDTDLRRWGLKIAMRGGKNAKKRARVAVARKLAVLMHRLWVTGEEYQPLGYATKNTQTQAA